MCCAYFTLLATLRSGTGARPRERERERERVGWVTRSRFMSACACVKRSVKTLPPARQRFPAQAVWIFRMQVVSPSEEYSGKSTVAVAAKARSVVRRV